MTGLLLALAAPASTAALAQAQAELRASQAALAAHNDGFFLDADRRAPALLDRHWAAIRRWTEAWLDANGLAAERRLPGAAKAAEKELDLSAVAIAPDTLAVAAQENEIGTLFIVRRANNGFHTVWTVSAPGRAALAAYPMLAGWTPAAAAPPPNQGWSPRHPRGPLYGSIGLLPRDANGNVRFYIQATYAQPAGATVGGQISIWRWNGRTATSLFADSYAYMADQPYGVGYRAGVLHVGVKTEFKSFYSCGACNGRQMDWRIAVGPGGVRDLGRVDRYPELVFIDDVLDRLTHHLSVPRAASGADLGLLRRQEFDMVGGWAVHRRGRGEELCIGWEDATDIFVLERASSGFRLLSVRKGPRTGCPGRTNS